MLYPELEAAMARRHVTAAQIARCAGVGAGDVRRWMGANDEQFPVRAAFTVQARLFPDRSVEALFAPGGAPLEKAKAQGRQGR